MTAAVPDLILAFVTYLKADTSVSAIVGAKVYRSGDVPTAPAPPYLVVSEVSDLASQFKADARVQCSCFAAKDREAANLSKTVRNALHRKVNMLMTAGSKAVWVSKVMDAGDTPDPNDEIKVYAHHRDFAVDYDYQVR